MRKNFSSELTTKESAVIVGASLSGLMTGIALSRAGISVTILERTGAKPSSGAVLQVDSGEIDRTKTAKFLRKLASNGIRSAEAWTSIQLRLRTAAENDPNIDLSFDTRVQSVQQDSESAWVVTDKGVFQGDILIGADGHKSNVRRQVAPHKPNATFAGYLIWVAIEKEKNIPENSRPNLHTPRVAMPDGIGDFLLGTIIAGVDGSVALGDRRLGWAWYDNTQNELLRRLGCVDGTVVQHSLHVSDIPEKTLLELAEKASVRWSQPWLDTILYSIKTRNLIGAPIAEYIPDKLAKGRIAIVGDAAHLPTPLTASGFNASLQDAAILAECVKNGIRGTDACKALLEYEFIRLENVRQIVQSGQSFSRAFGR
ncbi:FAD-dependent monooxygenase [[Brevibacterium] frigoritolerans]|nr:FAD-dependent monooxygenase [Peribacillus frigoritolerans]